MEKAAPKDAPWVTPKVEEDAKGFLNRFCIITPDKERAAPTRAPVIIRGNLIFSIIEEFFEVLLFIKTLITSDNFTSEEPIVEDILIDKINNTNNTKIIIIFFLIKFLYSFIII